MGTKAMGTGTLALSQGTCPHGFSVVVVGLYFFIHQELTFKLVGI